MAGTVRQWMSSPVVVVDPDSTVSHALTLMRRRHIHSVVVDLSAAGGDGYGIVTSTDIRDKIAAAGRKPSEATVGEIMTSPVLTARPNWTLAECSRVMQEKHIHHMPVTDDAGTLLGMISATDIFNAVEEAGWETEP